MMFQDCGPCRAPDCGECVFCLDKRKFGGPNKKRHACAERKCLKMNLTTTKVSPAQSDEESRVETTEETDSNSSESEGSTMKDEVRDAVKHDHCYCLNEEVNIDLWCHESLDEFIAETLGVKLQKRFENQEELDHSLTFVPRRLMSEEDEETRKFFKVDLIPPTPVYYEDSKKHLKGELLEIQSNPKDKRRRRNFN